MPKIQQRTIASGQIFKNYNLVSLWIVLLIFIAYSISLAFLTVYVFCMYIYQSALLEDQLFSNQDVTYSLKDNVMISCFGHIYDAYGSIWTFFTGLISKISYKDIFHVVTTGILCRLSKCFLEFCTVGIGPCLIKAIHRCQNKDITLSPFFYLVRNQNK